MELVFFLSWLTTSICWLHLIFDSLKVIILVVGTDQIHTGSSEGKKAVGSP